MMTGIVGGLLLLNLGVIGGRGLVVVSDDPLAGYPDEGDLARRLKWHRERHWDKDGEPRVAMSWFAGGDPASAWLCQISESGQVLVYFDAMHLSRRAASQNELDEAQQARVDGLLDRFPPFAEHPPLEDLLIVSFLSDDRWQSRTYRRSALPEPVQELAGILGVRERLSEP